MILKMVTTRHKKRELPKQFPFGCGDEYLLEQLVYHGAYFLF